MSHKKFIYDVGFSGISSISTVILSFFLSIILARFLGPAGLGLYRTAFIVYGIAMLFATFGIPVAIVKFVAENIRKKNKLRNTISLGSINALIIGALTGIILFSLSGLISNIFKMPNLRSLLLLVAIVLPFSALFSVQISILNGLRRMKHYAFFVILEKSLMLIFLTAFVLLGFGPAGAISGLLVSSIISSIIIFLYLSPFFYFKIKNYWENTKRLLSFSKNLFGAGVTNLAENQTDTILIAYFLTATDVGYYSIAISLLRFFPLIPSAIQTITYPATSSYLAEKNSASLQKMLDKSIKYSTMFLLPLGLLIYFFAKEIITLLYGEVFVVAIIPLYLLLTARIIRGSIIVPIGGSLTAAGKPKLAFQISLVSTVLSIILNILMIPKMGIVGAALAAAISLLFGTVLQIIFTVKIVKFKFDYKWYIAIYGLSMLSVIIFTSLKKFVNIFVLGGAILILFVFVIYVLFIQKEDKQRIFALISSILKRKK